MKGLGTSFMEIGMVDSFAEVKQELQSLLGLGLL